MIAELSGNGLICIYKVDDRQYLEITGWHHQKIDKPQKPKFPCPIVEPSTNAPRTFASERNTECRIDGNGIEPYRDEIKAREALPLIAEMIDSKDAQASVCSASVPAHTGPEPIDPTYRPPEHLVNQCHADGATDAIIDEQVMLFIAWHQDRGTLSRNWDAAWTMWWGRWKQHRAKEAAKGPRLMNADAYTPTDLDWDRLVGRWGRNNSLWSRQFGPEPGMIGCRCPPDILRKHGIDPATGLKMRRA